MRRMEQMLHRCRPQVPKVSFLFFLFRFSFLVFVFGFCLVFNLFLVVGVWFLGAIS